MNFHCFLHGVGRCSGSIGNKSGILSGQCIDQGGFSTVTLSEEGDVEPVGIGGVKVYQFDLVTIGENSVIPDGVKVGKNTAIAGETTVGDYPDGLLAGGNYIIKAGGVK